MKRVFTTAAALIAIWGIAAAIVGWARSAAPTPESVIQLVEEKPLADVPASERESQIRKVAAQLNRLDFEQRRGLRNTESFEQFIRSMNPDEMSQFLDLTLPEGFRQLMIALNNMEPERRKQIVDRALAELEENGTRRNPSVENEAYSKKIIAEGMSVFYEDASVDVKLDFAPLIEQIQKSLQSGR
ncbi:MAG: hypothetical protein ACOVMP_00655 [Chthoniobacterales bacterium]